MQKLMKNWVFTLVVCILTALLGLLMLLDTLSPGDFFFSKKILHLLAALALALYTVCVIFPLTLRYHGKARFFVIGESLLLVLLVIGLFWCNFSDKVPFLSSLQICSMMGFALWMRGAVGTVRAYLARGTGVSHQTPLWGLCLYILLSAVGVWQMFAPTVQDNYFIYCLAAMAFFIAIVFGYATVMNRLVLRVPGKKLPDAVPIGTDVAETTENKPQPAAAPESEPEAEPEDKEPEDEAAVEPANPQKETK